jgi:endonuclease YncB( thermonuclease family)
MMIVPVADMPPSKGSMIGIRLLAGRLLLGGALLLSLGAAARAADEIHGDATVISGNEIQVGKRIVRLFGIVAPGLQDTCDINEAKMKCGIVAWAELIKLADGQEVSCDAEELPAGVAPPKSDMPFVFGTCYIGETDLNEAMVRSGWARAVLPQTDRYEVDESDAKDSRRGLWSNQVKSGGRARRRRKSVKFR